MHAQALLWATTITASGPGSGMGTLRARMHAMALLYHFMFAASSPRHHQHAMGACMHACAVHAHDAVAAPAAAWALGARLHALCLLCSLALTALATP